MARLVLKSAGKRILETNMPSYGRKSSNDFHFAIAPENLAEAEFALSESVVGGTAEDPVPLPGTVHYQFRLREHVPPDVKL